MLRHGPGSEDRCPYQGKGWGKRKEDAGTGNPTLHTARDCVGKAFGWCTGRKDQKRVGRTEHARGHLPYGARVFSTLKCRQRRVTAGGATLDPGLGGDTEKATLEWMIEALKHARARGQTMLVGYLEEVADEVAFEVEATRGRTFK
jgi:hypothetical protein